MTDAEFDLLDELYFVTPFRVLREKTGLPAAELLPLLGGLAGARPGALLLARPRHRAGLRAYLVRRVGPGCQLLSLQGRAAATQHSLAMAAVGYDSEAVPGGLDSAVVVPPPVRTPGYYVRQRLRANRPAVAGLGFIILCALVALLGYWILPDNSPDANNGLVQLQKQPPGFVAAIRQVPDPNALPPGNALSVWLHGRPPQFKRRGSNCKRATSNEQRTTNNPPLLAGHRQSRARRAEPAAAGHAHLAGYRAGGGAHLAGAGGGGRGHGRLLRRLDRQPVAGADDGGVEHSGHYAGDWHFAGLG